MNTSDSVESLNTEFSNTPVDLKQRKDLEFDFTDAPAVWLNGSVKDSHILNAFSLVAPHSERYFVHIMREAKKLVPEKYGKLQEDMTGFVQQEGMHARVHHEFNQHLASLGYDLTKIDALFEDMFNSYRQYPIRKQLAILAAGEHMTYLMGIIGLNTNFLDDSVPSVRRMWIWHALEEIEHKSVAFDVCAYMGTGYFERLWGLYKVLTTYGRCIAIAKVRLSRQEKTERPKSRRSMAARFKRAFVNPGYFRSAVVELIKYLHPNFIVWNEEELDEHIEMLNSAEKDIYNTQPSS